MTNYGPRYLDEIEKQLLARAGLENPTNVNHVGRVEVISYADKPPASFGDFSPFVVQTCKKVRFRPEGRPSYRQRQARARTNRTKTDRPPKEPVR